MVDRAVITNPPPLADLDDGSVATGGWTEPTDGGGFAGNLNLVMQIPVTLRFVLGTTSMPVAALLKLGRGTVVPLDRRVGEPVEVVVNNHVVAMGEVVVINDDGSKFGISLTEIIGSPDGTVARKA
jgi:flagellar motor switch protein FliN